MTLIPDADTLPQPELFPKRIGWVVHQIHGQRALDQMQWGVPSDRGPVTNVRNLKSGFWRNMLANRLTCKTMIPLLSLS